MDSDTATSYELLGTIEQLDNITQSSLYDAYKTLRKEFKVDIFLIGNLEMDDMATLIKKYFKNRYIVDINFDMMVDNKEVKKVHEASLKSENIQTNLVMLFNLKNLNDLEKNITLNAFNYIYGSGGLTSKLYKSIREENSLCYAINSMYLKYDGLLMVQISLDQCNVKKAISLVKKELKKMQNGEFSDMELNDAINNMIISLDMSLDNNVAILNNYVFNIYDNLPLIEKRKEYFKEINKNDIINVSKKIKLNTIFTLEGKDS